MRQGARQILAMDEALIAAIDEATISASQLVDSDMVAMIYKANRMNILHWAREISVAPQRPVSANLSVEMVQLARFQARLGIDEATERAYRSGQQAAWLKWMQIVFSLSNDPALLQEVLEYSARSINAFVEATLAGLAERVAEERRALSQGAQAERRQLVQDFINGKPMHSASLGRKLGYGLDQPHWAAILWTDTPHQGPDAQEVWVQVQDAFSADRKLLVIAADRATIWLWGPAPPAAEEILNACPSHYRLAIGASAPGPEGFLSSHRSARLTQSILASAPAEKRLASYHDVRLISLITSDRGAVDSFLRSTLGPLESAAPKLRASLLTYLKTGCSLVETARLLDLHRNTLMRHLARAQDLLPIALNEATRIEVSVALELLYWREGEQPVRPA
ncbi:MAG: helix-turn-helix domain-containing protein [Mangrovicoccus sp.]|nr:helix-turn-helix domain-containing protein [Mangrovicoccus sp.]